jgi:hypothetical protein
VTALDALEEVLRAGGRIIPDPTRPRLVVPPDLKPLVLEHRAALRALVLARAAPTLPVPVPGVSDARARCAYAFPWPNVVHGLGVRAVGPYHPCADCGRGSWVRYGSVVLCCACASTREHS